MSGTGRTSNFELKITLIYFTIGVAWILFSDKILETTIANNALLTEFQTYKGSFYIVVTSILLYLLVKNHLQKLRAIDEKRTKSESHYKALFNDNQSIIVLINPVNGRIEDANPAACAFYGWPHNEFCRKTVYEISIQSDEKINKRLQLVNDQFQHHLIARHKLSNGEIRDVEVYSGPVQIGNETKLYTTIQDITEQKKAEERIHESEERYRTTLDQMLEGCQILGFDWTYQYINRAAELHNRKPNHELLGQRYMDIWPGITETQVFEAIKGVLENRIPCHMENRFQYPDGRIGWFDLSIQPVLEGVFILSVDISERKQKEQELNESEFRFRKLFENGPFGMVTVNKDLQFKKANKTFCAILGYEEYELLNLTFKDVSYEEDLQNDLPFVEKLMRKEISVYKSEKRYIRKDGIIIWASLTVIPNYDSEGNFLYNLGVVEDITWRKQVENALRESKEFLKLGYETAKLGIWKNNTLTGEIEFDEQARLHYGFDTRFTTLSEVLALIHPDDMDRLSKEIEKAISPDGNDRYSTEYRVIHPDGSIHWLYVGVRIRFEGEGENRHSVMGLGTTLEITDLKQLEISLKQKNVEYEKVNQQLLQTNNEVQELNEHLEMRVADRTALLESANMELEAFSYSVSHDLRAPLRHINGYMDLLQSRFSENLPEKAQYYMNTILDSTRQMGVLIDDLLQFSKSGRTELNKAIFDMNPIVSDIIRDLKEDNANRNIVWQVDQLPVVQGDCNMLKQVWINLLENAVKYSKNVEIAEIKIAVGEETDNFIFSVQDNGVGFDMKYAHKLFGVFQRLHSQDEFEGTGIGLANVQRILMKHNGKVWVEAEPDKGATFYFSLPKSQEELK